MEANEVVETYGVRRESIWRFPVQVAVKTEVLQSRTGVVSTVTQTPAPVKVSATTTTEALPPVSRRVP